MGAIRNAFRVLLVLWAGSLWSLAAWVAPTLFYAQADRHLAGVLAARLFSHRDLPRRRGRRARAAAARQAQDSLWVYVAAALLAINEWVLKPLHGRRRTRAGAAPGLTFGAWHGVSAVLYVLACLAVVLLVWKEDFR